MSFTINQTGGREMKKVLMAVLAVFIGIAFVTSVFAQSATDKATKAATDTAQEKAKAAPAPEKKAAPKGKVQQYRGEVTGMDTAAKTLTVKGKKGDMTFDVTDAKMKAEPKAGDKVMVKYMEKDGKMVAKSVSMKGVKKAGKKEAKPAAPAPAPAK
jgi:microtubule-associated protein 1